MLDSYYKEDYYDLYSTPNEDKYQFNLVCLHWHPIGSYPSDDPHTKSQPVKEKVNCELW